jgi:hypothetical protein
VWWFASAFPMHVAPWAAPPLCLSRPRLSPCPLPSPNRTVAYSYDVFSWCSAVFGSCAVVPLCVHCTVVVLLLVVAVVCLPAWVHVRSRMRSSDGLPSRSPFVVGGGFSSARAWGGGRGGIRFVAAALRFASPALNLALGGRGCIPPPRPGRAQHQCRAAPACCDCLQLEKREDGAPRCGAGCTVSTIRAECPAVWAVVTPPPPPLSPPPLPSLPLALTDQVHARRLAAAKAHSPFLQGWRLQRRNKVTVKTVVPLVERGAPHHHVGVNRA